MNINAKQILYFGNPVQLFTEYEQLIIKYPKQEKEEPIYQTEFDKIIDEDFNKTRSKIKSLKNTFLEKSQIPINQIALIELDNSEIILSVALLQKLLLNNVIIVTCDTSHLPTGLTYPLVGNVTQQKTQRHQLNASQPLNKNLWKQTIEQKIINQKLILDYLDINSNRLKFLSETVKSGDTDNNEAQAAAYYWEKIFTFSESNIHNFKRERFGLYPNSLLNYGYAIIRAVIARALISAGLSLSIGIFHKNQYNPFPLADDIMEPYRPFVDSVIIDILKKNDDISEISKEHKTLLLNIPVLDVVINGQRSPLMIAVAQTTASLYQCFAGKIRKIKYPSFE